MTNLQAFIGMEVHVELNTKSKMFCGCPTKHFQIKPNTHTCPVCLGLPGALPVPNKQAVDWTVMLGLALNCTVNKTSKFDRKHYFYPDLPKGYQISQYDQPLTQTGFLTLGSGKKIHINRVHLEEDTAKLLHKTINGKKVSLVDFNRSGVPLMEIVSAPEISFGTEAKEYLKKLTQIIKTLKISDCDMEKGSMRLEANISVMDQTTTRRIYPNYKVEVKNLNSFRFVEQAINYEIKRQTALLWQGTKPKQETRGFNPKTKKTFVMRSKETAEDYRYFPEPDIPPMVFTNKQIARLQSQLPELPEAKIEKLATKHQLSSDIARLLVNKPQNYKYFIKSLSIAKKHQLSPKKLANLIINKKINLSQPVTKQLQFLTQKQAVSQSIINQVLKDNLDVVKKYKAGKASVIGFLVGQVMKTTQGQADPNLARKLLLEKLAVKK
jgi:aspartyl-tRNA(Asn)/glutamyl-tRNA(Gln) amidotransferase subunit B